MMEDHIRYDILDVISHAEKAIEREDVKALKDLSNMTIHNVSIHQDVYSTLTAVLIYTFAKMYERSKYEQLKGWDLLCKDCNIWLRQAREALEEKDDIRFESILKQTFAMMKKLDPKLRRYIQDVIRKAKVTKASRMYEHGISLGRTAEVLGVTQYELMDYVGSTYIADVKENKTMSVQKRLQLAREVFR